MLDSLRTASLVNRHVQFLSLDALSFHAPVPIGAMLQLSSQIAYTSQPDQHLQGHTIASVTLLAQVVDLETGERKKSNTVSRLLQGLLPYPRPQIVETDRSPTLSPARITTVSLQLRPRQNRLSGPTTNLQGGNGVYRGQAKSRDRC